MYTRMLTINTKSEESILLFGPRGTGKTHWVTTDFPNALYIDLLDTSTYLQKHCNTVYYQKHFNYHPPNII